MRSAEGTEGARNTTGISAVAEAVARGAPPRDSRHGPRWRRISDRIRTDAAPRRTEEINFALCWRRRYAKTDIQMVTSGILWNRREVPGRTALSTLCPARCTESKATKPTTNPAVDYQPMYLLEVC